MRRLPDINITIDGVTYESTYNDDVHIDHTNLEQEFLTHAEKYTYYAFLAAAARDKAVRKKDILAQIYAVVDSEKRTAPKAPGLKYTETMYENEVKTDPRYKQAQTEFNDAELLANQLQQVAIGMAHRRDMLIQLGGMARQSMAPTRIVEQHAQTAQDLIAQTRAAQQAPSLPPPVAEAPEPSTVEGSEPPRRRRQPVSQ